VLCAVLCSDSSCLLFACTLLRESGSRCGPVRAKEGVSLVPRGAARKGEMARCALTRAALAAGEEPGCSVE
jgi:hypothetical protein